MVARHPVRDAAAEVVSDQSEAREPERAHDRDLIGGYDARAAARFHPWREGCDRPQSRYRLSRSPEGRSWTASPSPALPFHPGQSRIQGFGEVLDAPRLLQRTPLPPHRGLADGGATVGQILEQVALCRWWRMGRAPMLAPQNGIGALFCVPGNKRHL
jgi:hypothetical protein